jgi:uncharacterized coiled-coil DUF342 family protein
VMKLTTNGHEISKKPEDLQENTISALQKQIAEMNQQIINLQNEIIKNNEELKELILKMTIYFKKRK